MGHGRLRDSPGGSCNSSRRRASFRVVSDIGCRGERWRRCGAQSVRAREVNFEPDTSGCKEALMPLSKHCLNPVLVSQCVFAPRAADSVFARTGLGIWWQKVIEKGVPVLLLEIPMAILVFRLWKGKMVPRSIRREYQRVVKKVRWIFDGTRPIFKVFCSRWKLMVILKHRRPYVPSTKIGIKIDMEVFCRD